MPNDAVNHRDLRNKEVSPELDTAVTGLIIFAFCIVLFVIDKLPMATSAIFGCALMVLFGVCDFSTAFGQMASGSVIMLIGVMITGAAVSECGLASRIGGAVARFGGKGERAFIAASFVIAFFLSSFLTNVSVLAIFIPIVYAVSRSDGGISPLNAVIPLVLAVNMGGISTLIGSSQQMTAQGLLMEYGYGGFTVFQFLPFGIILGAVALLYVLFIGYPLGKRIWGAREEGIENVAASASDIPLDKRRAITVTVIFCLSVALYVFQRVPFTEIAVPPHFTAVLSALACIVTGGIGQKKAIQSVNWNIVGRLGGSLGLAKALSVSGGISLLSDGITCVVGDGASPFILFALITLVAQIISLFISNSTAISVTLLATLAVAPALSLNVPAYAMGIVLAASMGASCPLSGSTWGMSMSVGYRFRDYLKYGVTVDLLSYIIVLITVPLLMGLSV